MKICFYKNLSEPVELDLVPDVALSLKKGDFIKLDDGCWKIVSRMFNHLSSEQVSETELWIYIEIV